MAVPISFANAQDQSDQKNKEQATLLNALLFKDLPTFGQRQIVVYEQHFFSRGTAEDGVRPSNDSVKAAVANAIEQRDSAEASGMEVSDTVALVVTRWPTWPFSSLEEHRTSMTHYADLADRFVGQSGMKVCFYGIFPNASIAVSTRVQKENDLKTERDVAMSITAEILGKNIDAVCPLLYTYYNGDTEASRQKAIEQWKLFASDTLELMNQFAPDKPVHAFIWPQFHSGGGIKGQPDLPKSYWHAELDHLLNKVDAIAIWGGFDLAEREQQEWQSDSDWWNVVQEVFPAATQP